MSSFIKTIKEDYLQRYNTDSQITYFKLFKGLILDLNFRVVFKYRVQSKLYSLSNGNKMIRFIAVCIRNSNIKRYSVEFGLTSQIAGGLTIHHLNGIVIGEGVRIGKNFNLFQQVTIGKKRNGYPTIGDNVWVYPGAKIIGDIRIDNNVIIGTNSVVIKSIPENTIVGGVPAKNIGYVENHE
ncbi:serine acetyltransferase [Niallia taxi]|uniref:serine O-acetyltransferase n=1 Tax=Niallia taxi TaxID=2499688 RepID=UPI00203EF42A|nr:serine acetyltransferase [Niallia taxi]MCM3216407.1 serine acetyltransferase [Niallia taxi]